MKKIEKLLVVSMLIWSVFLTGCDVSKLSNIVQSIANGIQQAIPAIQNLVNTVQGAANGMCSGNTTQTASTQQSSSNGAGGVVSSASDGTVATNNGGTSSSSSTSTAGPIQTRVSNSIKSLLGSTRFRGRDVDGGNLACAKVVSTALKMAGVLDRVVLNCDAVVSALKRKGWRRVRVPPYHDGDVVTWTTRRGPGRHIGIIVKDGNTFSAISNSSKRRTPRRTRVTYLPITQVLRKV